MKNFILVFTISLLMFSCENAPSNQVEASPKEIGFDISEGVRTPLYAGDMNSVAVWEKYIKAHNEKDIETIKGLNAAEGFKAYGPDGTIFNGTDAHIAFLTEWFNTNPKWETKYLIANAFTSKDGKVKQYVTSGHDVTLMVDGKEVKVNQVHDALIVNGKVQTFYVNERVLVE
tara:strand:- start:2498 stop:3016 length:519 start_codon:yes stop_codon:yes gene_type:complete